MYLNENTTLIALVLSMVVEYNFSRAKKNKLTKFKFEFDFN